MVALFIFAILGVMASIALHSLLGSYQHIKKTDKQLQKIEIMMSLLRQDLSQIIARPSMNANGAKMPAVYAENSSRITFTRAGINNPLMLAKRSDMQRVMYVWQDGKLMRVSWPVVDRTADTPSTTQVLFTHVESLHWQFLNAKNQSFPSWPPNVRNNKTLLPKAIIVTIYLPHQQRVQAVVPIQAREVKQNA